MLEILAIAARDTAPTTLDAWVDALRVASGLDVVISREPPDGAWLEMGALRTRGYAVLQGTHVDAINFELSAPNPEPVVDVLAAAATALRWELHEDEDDEDDDD
jgi:hypothetical protein